MPFPKFVADVLPRRWAGLLLWLMVLAVDRLNARTVRHLSDEMDVLPILNEQQISLLISAGVEIGSEGIR